jgi:hypothetical protein
MPPFGRMPVSRNAGLRMKIVTGVPSVRFSVVVPLPRSYSAMCSTIMLPRGVIWANPFGSTVPIRPDVRRVGAS